jgi:hypothetical protein
MDRDGWTSHEMFDSALETLHENRQEANKLSSSEEEYQFFAAFLHLDDPEEIED